MNHIHEFLLVCWFNTLNWVRVGRCLCIFASCDSYNGDETFYLPQKIEFLEYRYFLPNILFTKYANSAHFNVITFFFVSIQFVFFISFSVRAHESCIFFVCSAFIKANVCICFKIMIILCFWNATQLTEAHYVHAHYVHRLEFRKNIFGLTIELKLLRTSSQINNKDWTIFCIEIWMFVDFSSFFFIKPFPYLRVPTSLSIIYCLLHQY